MTAASKRRYNWPLKLPEAQRPPDIYNELWDNTYKCTHAHYGHVELIYRYEPTREMMRLQTERYDRYEVYFKPIYVNQEALKFLLSTRFWKLADERENLF
jgi:hypothetical protein